MENYIKNFELFNNIIIYDFNAFNGGIGDYIKFFIHCLQLCIKNNQRLYCKQNNIYIEKYIKLKYDIMYITDDNINKLNNFNIIVPSMLYNDFNYNNINIDINNVFYFTEEVKINSNYLFSQDITNYISIHIRLGDKFLETDSKYISCKDDIRLFSEENIYNFIDNNYHQNIFVCCDNNTFKLNLKNKYNNIIITNCDIGHTSLYNTTIKQILDAITEFYILTNSKSIYSASYSGFSIMASKFNNIPLFNI